MIDALNFGLLQSLRVSLPQKALIPQSSEGERRIGKPTFHLFLIPSFPISTEKISLSSSSRLFNIRKQLFFQHHLEQLLPDGRSRPLSLLVMVAWKPPSHEPDLSFHLCFDTNLHYTLPKDVLCSERWLEAIFHKSQRSLLSIPNFRDTHKPTLKF